MTSRLCRPAPFCSGGRLRWERATIQPMTSRAARPPWMNGPAGWTVPRAMLPASRSSGATTTAYGLRQTRDTA